MPRDSNGNYTLPSGNPVVTGTTISSTWANPTLGDVAQELSNSLDRQGRGGMLAPFRFVDGTVSGPGSTWGNEPTSGFYRAGAQDMRATVSGTDRMRWTASGVDVWNGSAWSAVQTALTLATALSPYTQRAAAEGISGAWTFSQPVTLSSVANAAAISFDIGGTARVGISATGLDVTGTLSQGGVAAVLASRSVATSNSLTGGGNLGADRTLQLVNDTASPGASWYYGTNSSGAKGWNPLSGVVGVPEAPVDGESYARKDASWVSLGTGGSQYVLKSGDTMTGPLTLPGGGTGLNAATITDAISLSNSAVSTHVGQADPHTQYLLETGGAISGALTVGTTLGVSGASTLAAATLGGLLTMNASGSVRNGGTLSFNNTGNSLTKSIVNNGIGLAINANGGLWHWASNTFTGGTVTAQTTVPAASGGTPGSVVLVYA